MFLQLRGPGGNRALIFSLSWSAKKVIPSISEPKAAYLMGRYIDDVLQACNSCRTPKISGVVFGTALACCTFWVVLHSLSLMLKDGDGFTRVDARHMESPCGPGAIRIDDDSYPKTGDE